MQRAAMSGPTQPSPNVRPQRLSQTTHAPRSCSRWRRSAASPARSASGSASATPATALLRYSGRSSGWGGVPDATKTAQPGPMSSRLTASLSGSQSTVPPPLSPCSPAESAASAGSSVAAAQGGRNCGVPNRLASAEASSARCFLGPLWGRLGARYPGVLLTNMPRRPTLACHLFRGNSWGLTVTVQQQIEAFLSGTPHAVVGASRDREKYGNKVLRAYVQWLRTVFPVNPRAEAVEGLVAYPDLASLPQPVHGLSVVTPPRVTGLAVAEAARCKRYRPSSTARTANSAHPPTRHSPPRSLRGRRAQR